MKRKLAFIVATMFPLPEDVVLEIATHVSREPGHFLLVSGGRESLVRAVNYPLFRQEWIRRRLGIRSMSVQELEIDGLAEAVRRNDFAVVSLLVRFQIGHARCRESASWRQWSEEQLLIHEACRNDGDAVLRELLSVIPTSEERLAALLIRRPFFPEEERSVFEYFLPDTESPLIVSCRSNGRKTLRTILDVAQEVEEERKERRERRERSADGQTDPRTDEQNTKEAIIDPTYGDVVPRPVGAGDIYNRTLFFPMAHACFCLSSDVVTELVDAGANVLAPLDHYNTDALTMITCARSLHRVFRVFRTEHSTRIDQKMQDMAAALLPFRHIDRNNIDLIGTCRVTTELHHALLLAAKYDNAPVMRVALARCAASGVHVSPLRMSYYNAYEPEDTRCVYHTPLLLACRERCYGIAHMILDAASDAPSSSSSSFPPQALSARSARSAQLVRLDIEAERRALWGACFKGDAETVMFLIEQGSKHFSRDDVWRGETLLEAAVRMGHDHIVSILIA